MSVQEPERARDGAMRMPAGWHHVHSRADALKLAAAAGLGFDLLGRAAPAVAGNLSGTLTLTWNYAPGPGFKQTRRMYNRYMALHPQARFSDIHQPTGDYTAQTAWLTSRELAGRVPDIFEPFTVSTVMDGVPKHWWVTLDPYLDQPNPYVKGNKRWRDQIVPALLNQGKYLDNKTYCFAADAAEWAVYYNKSIFKKAGVQPPTSWAEMLNVSRKLIAAGYNAFSFVGIGGITSLSVVVESMLQAGAFKSRANESYFFSSLDFCHAVKRGKLAKTDQRTRAAWQLLKEFSAYWPKGTLSASDFRAFTSGKTGMWYDGSWDSAAILAAVKGAFDIGVFPVPPVTKATSPLAIGDTYTGIGVLASANPLAVSSGAARSGHLELAIDFLRFLTQPDVIGPMSVEGGTVPALVGTKPSSPILKVFADEVIPKQSLIGPVYFDLAADLTVKQGQLCQGYLSGALSLDSALSQMQQVQMQVVTKALASAGLS